MGFEAAGGVVGLTVGIGDGVESVGVSVEFWVGVVGFGVEILDGIMVVGETGIVP